MLNLLRKILMITMALKISEIQILLLEKIIARFIQIWNESYDTFPKLHFMVHIPNTIRKYLNYVNSLH